MNWKRLIIKNLKYILMLLGGLLSYIVIINHPEFNTDILCWKASIKFERYSCSGIVKKKYIDKKNHNNKTFVVSDNGQFRKEVFDRNDGGFFDYIEENDSISKQSGTTIVTVFRKGIPKEFVFEYNCEGDPPIN